LLPFWIFTTRYARDAELTEGFVFLICRETTANQNQAACGPATKLEQKRIAGRVTWESQTHTYPRVPTGSDEKAEG
jgi:hypothetical protein